jgi:hypothetical protein
MNDEPRLGGTWTNIALVNVLDLYEEDGGNLISLACHSSIKFIFASNTIVNCQRSVLAKNKSRTRLRKLKVSTSIKNYCSKNNAKVRDVPILKLIVTTLEEGKNTSLTPKDAFYNLFGAFDKGNIT